MKLSNSSTDNKVTLDEKYIRQQCDELLTQAEIKNPPVNLRMLASFAGISSIKEVSMKEAGMLCPADSGLVMLLRDTDGEGRKNFTCGHEITHTFFPNYREKPQKRVDDEVGKYDSYDKTEYLCDFGASYLLMPDFLFLPEFEKVGFSADSLGYLSNTFESSLEATAIRMVSQDTKKYAVVVWEEKYKPTEKGLEAQTSFPGFEFARPQKKLRVKFGYGFDKKDYIPKNKSLDESGSLVADSYSNDVQNTGMSQLTFNRDFKIDCKIYTFPLTKQGRIITLLEKN
jgi:Zn-dependent peptidase ImmA (M78 family)